jgi:hypothetical protein
MSEGTRYFQASARKHFLRQIESLAQQQNRHLFVANEQSDNYVFGLTKVRRVLAVDGDEVRLSESHARHRVSPSAPSLAVGKWYEMAIDPASNKILEAFERQPQVVFPPPQTSTFPIDIGALPPVSRYNAEAFFSKVRRQPHIPFQYPANGCWARAHEMCRLIERHFDLDLLDVVAKIWNFGELKVKSDNNPTCLVEWKYHVAPVVRVGTELLVIDPSLFEGLVTIDVWQDRQSELSRDSIFTTRDAYNIGGNHVSGEEQLFVEEAGQAAEQLQEFWGDLISLIVCNGPLPYRCDCG